MQWQNHFFVFNANKFCNNPIHPPLYLQYITILNTIWPTTWLSIAYPTTSPSYHNTKRPVFQRQQVAVPNTDIQSGSRVIVEYACSQRNYKTPVLKLNVKKRNPKPFLQTKAAIRCFTRSASRHIPDISITNVACKRATCILPTTHDCNASTSFQATCF